MKNIYIRKIGDFADTELSDFFKTRIALHPKNEARDRTIAAMLDESLQKFGLFERDMLYGISDSGKPYFKNCSLHFNFSHTEGYAALILCSAPCGVDIEPASRNIRPALTERFFSECERTLITSASDTRAVLLRLWTRKEALLKADGTGLRTKLAEVDVSKDTAIFDSKVYKIGDFSEKSFFCSACTAI